MFFFTLALADRGSGLLVGRIERLRRGITGITVTPISRPLVKGRE